MKDFADESFPLSAAGADALAGGAIGGRATLLSLLSPEVAAARAAPSHPFRADRTGTAPEGWYAAHGKRLADIVFVLFCAPLILGVVAVCALALWIEGGQPFYRQQRLGRDGRSFSILKLRTMVRDADACLQRHLERDPALALEWAISQKLKRDPRITRVGALLRATSLDEMPQFWNVLTGDMSIVGPRPMMPGQLALYGDTAAYFALRPGITGFWQVSARNQSHFSFRSEIDAQYRRHMSLACDLGVMLRTVGVMLRRTGY
ncbi:sugar transferase [Oceaniglobus roseus]|uniref:sugar transferase n=1 Tax=Oceaniglobus roseus TaxID=1737570 RepID=UPI001FE5F8FC|nr:sugar transferase [Kandeliimicrobium roseum]